MSALHKLKAYFGMVPVEEVDEYDDLVDDVDERDADAPGYGHFDTSADRVGARRRAPVGVRGGLAAESGGGIAPHDGGPPAARPRRQWAADAPVRGALAIDSQREQGTRLRAVTDTGSQYNLSKITTLHPRSYSEARTIGEQYRDGTPVIMNLTEMEEADAKRLVDFAAGLAFAMRGSIEKVTNRVFLLSPPNVDVAAEDKRRLAEGAFFNYG